MVIIAVVKRQEEAFFKKVLFMVLANRGKDQVRNIIANVSIYEPKK